MQPIPEKCFICQKLNDIEIRKQKNNVVLSVEVFTHSAAGSCSHI
jgi:hypothetical protein